MVLLARGKPGEVIVGACKTLPESNKSDVKQFKCFSEKSLGCQDCAKCGSF